MACSERCCRAEGAASIDRVAIYADDSDELARLRAYVERRRWDCSGHEYITGQWSQLIAAADRCLFHAICASVNGLVVLIAAAIAPARHCFHA